MSVVLYHHPGSLCSQKVRLALAEKGVDHSRRTVNIGPAAENLQPWYMKLNPNGVIPTLVHDGQPVTDSARIVRYIDERFPGPELHATSEEGKAIEARWLDAADRIPLREISYGRVKGPFGWLLRRSDRLRLAKIRRLKAENPELSPLYDAKIADIEVWFATSRSKEKVSALVQGVGALLGELDTHLADRAFINGERYGVADILWTVVLARLVQLGLGEEVTSRPRVAAYYARMKERPSFAAAGVWESVPWRAIVNTILGRN